MDGGAKRVSFALSLLIILPWLSAACSGASPGIDTPIGRFEALLPENVRVDANVWYTPPFVPVTFNYSLATGEFGIATGVAYHTPVGTFGITPQIGVRPEIERSLQELDAQPTDLVLLFTNRRRNETTVYHVKDGHDATVVMDGRVVLNVEATRYGTVVALDVTDAKVVELYPRDALIEQGHRPPQAQNTDSGSRLQPSPRELTPESAGCLLPEFVAYEAVPTGKHGEFRFRWHVIGADLVEMWGIRYPAQHEQVFIVKEEGWWPLWAKVAGTPDDCYAEKALFLDP